jgi:hypothetical protein
VERRASAELGAGEAEQLGPQVASEDGVPIAHDRHRDRRQDPMEPDNVVEECLGNGRCGVGVDESDEVAVFGETVQNLQRSPLRRRSTPRLAWQAVVGGLPDEGDLSCFFGRWSSPG